MKKVLSLILAMAMILSSFSFAFALPSDVEGTDYENAVARLAALDIIVGYEDGTFRPDNSITRAEFAAIAIRSLGMEDIAEGSLGITDFPDVKANHWASGYVNLAAAQGIIVGYPDGTFRPENQVTYSEAIAMIVRLLGYEPALNRNVWPSNYLTKASEIGLTLGIKFNANDPAKRGVVSTLVNKATQSMGVVVIGGLALSTVLTLVIVPVMYTIFDDIADFFKRKLSKNKTKLQIN